jgi:hypothetical protein
MNETEKARSMLLTPSGTKGTMGLTGTRPQAGLSLIQVMLAIVVTGIITGYGIARLSAFLKQKTLQGDLQTQLAFAQQGRSIAIKKNVQVGIAFDATQRAVLLFEDANGDGAMQSGELARTSAFGMDIALGPAAKSPPASGPAGGTIPASGLSGAWSSDLLFGKDPMATPNVGAAYWHHRKLDAWTACLIRSVSSQQIQAYLWDGNAWRLL